MHLIKHFTKLDKKKKPWLLIYLDEITQCCKLVRMGRRARIVDVSLKKLGFHHP